MTDSAPRAAAPSPSASAEVGLCLDLLSRHAERRRGAAHHAGARPGVLERGLRARRRPAREGHGHRDRIRRQAPRRGAGSVVRSANREFGGMLGQSTARLGKDGKLHAQQRTRPVSTRSRPARCRSSPARRGQRHGLPCATIGGGDSESGSTPLAVAGEDVSGILLATSKGGTATGHVVFDGARPVSGLDPRDVDGRRQRWPACRRAVARGRTRTARSSSKG